MRIEGGIGALVLAAGLTTIHAGTVLAAGDCPSGSGSLVPTGLLAGVCVPGGPSSGSPGGEGGGEQAGGTGPSGGGGSGRNPYQWVRDWLDGDYGPYPRPDCRELPQDNCEDFDLGGVSSPLSCTLANGQPGRPFRDTLVNIDTGEIVSRAEGCFDPATGTSTGDGGTATGPSPPPPPPTPAEVLEAAALPQMRVGLSPSGHDCAVAGVSSPPSTPAPPCAAGTSPGLTGLETLLWVDPPPPAEVSVTVDIRGYSVTTLAHPVRYRWQMRQDGDAASTRNPAPTFETDGPGTRTAPAARYRWETKGDYHVSLAVVWEGSYTFTGFGVSRTEALGPVTGTATVIDYHVIEVRSVPAP